MQTLEECRKDILDLAKRYYGLVGYEPVPLTRDYIVGALTANKPYHKKDIESAFESLKKENILIEADTPDGLGIFAPRNYNDDQVRRAILKLINYHGTPMVWGPSKTIIMRCLTPSGHKTSQIDAALDGFINNHQIVKVESPEIPEFIEPRYIIPSESQINYLKNLEKKL